MSLTRVTAPTVDPVILADAKTHLRVTSTDEDSYITGLISAATAALDGDSGALGRALCQQTWDYKIDRFPYGNDPIRLPLPPVQSVTSVTYLDSSGNSQTLATSSYRVLLGGDWEPRIEREFNIPWPVTRQVREAVTIRYVAGYAPTTDSPPDYRANVPTAIKQAILLMVGHFYQNRESVIVGARAAAVEIPQGVESLIARFRVNGFGQ